MGGITSGCGACASLCATCSLNGAKSKCKTCTGTNKFTDLKDAGNGTCTESCGNGMFDDKNICKACAAHCKTCTDNSVGTCTECTDGNGFINGLINSACGHCDDGKILVDTLCRACGANCKTCSTAGANNTCLSCHDGFVHSGTPGTNGICTPSPNATYGVECLLEPVGNSAKTCDDNLVCTDTNTTEDTVPANVICLHAVDVACNTSDAKCGTDLVCDDEATRGTPATPTGKCKIDCGKTCVVGTVDDKCATGLVC